MYHIQVCWEKSWLHSIVIPRSLGNTVWSSSRKGSQCFWLSCINFTSWDSDPWVLNTGFICQSHGGLTRKSQLIKYSLNLPVVSSVQYSVCLRPNFWCSGVLHCFQQLLYFWMGACTSVLSKIICLVLWSLPAKPRNSGLQSIITVC